MLAFAVSACTLRPPSQRAIVDPPWARAQEPAPAPREPARAPQEPTGQQDVAPWRPPAPNPKDFDWIMLVSGEWLKGDITSLRRDKLEFDSDELDTLTLDWDDVPELRSPRQNTVALEGKREVTGTLLIRGDTVVVGTADGEQRFTRRDVVSIVPGSASEWDYWSGKLSFGLTMQSGNTNQRTANAQVNVTRRSAFSRVGIDYIGNLGDVEGVQNVNNHRATGRGDAFISKRWFLTPLSVDFFADAFQNIAYQITPGAGGGYYLLDESKVSWNLTLGGGWRYTRYDSVPAGSPPDDSTAAVIPGTNLEWDITPDLELDVGYSVEIGVPDTANTNSHLVATLSLDILGDLDLDVTFQWDRVGDPVADSAGVVPKKDDFRTTIGVGWEF